MVLQTWGEVFTSSLYNLWLGFADFVPALFLAIIIFILGWVIASVIGKLVSQIFSAIKLDKLLEEIGAKSLLQKAGFRLDSGHFFGELVKWFIVIVFLIASLETLGLSQVNEFLTVVLNYIPQVIIAALILVVATVVADAVRRLIEGSAKAMDVKSARMAGAIAKWAIWVFALIIALSELGIAPQFMATLFTGIIAMIALAGGLAFGLGGKEAAGRAINRISDSMSHR
jgi:hypothetical protein